MLLARARARTRAANAYFALFLLALAAFSYADAAELLFEYQLTGWTYVVPYATMAVFAGCFTLAVAHFVTPERGPATPMRCGYCRRSSRSWWRGASSAPTSIASSTSGS